MAASERPPSPECGCRLVLRLCRGARGGRARDGRDSWRSRREMPPQRESSCPPLARGRDTRAPAKQWSRLANCLRLRLARQTRQTRSYRISAAGAAQAWAPTPRQRPVKSLPIKGPADNIATGMPSRPPTHRQRRRRSRRSRLERPPAACPLLPCRPTTRSTWGPTCSCRQRQWAGAGGRARHRVMLPLLAGITSVARPPRALPRASHASQWVQRHVMSCMSRMSSRHVMHAPADSAPPRRANASPAVLHRRVLVPARRAHRIVGR